MYKLIKKLAKTYAKWKVSKLKDFSKLENIISKKKGKPVTITKEDALSVYSYLATGILEELSILIIIVLLSIILQIFIPTLVILISFLIFRFKFQGKHLNGYCKCVVFTTSYIILATYISDLLIPTNLSWLLKIPLYVIIGLGLELISLTKGFNKVLELIDKLKFND